LGALKEVGRDWLAGFTLLTSESFEGVDSLGEKLQHFRLEYKKA
jgi:hypothetical protein